MLSLPTSPLSRFFFFTALSVILAFFILPSSVNARTDNIESLERLCKAVISGKKINNIIQHCRKSIDSGSIESVEDYLEYFSVIDDPSDVEIDFALYILLNSLGDQEIFSKNYKCTYSSSNKNIHAKKLADLLVAYWPNAAPFFSETDKMQYHTDVRKYVMLRASDLYRCHSPHSKFRVIPFPVEEYMKRNFDLGYLALEGFLDIEKPYIGTNVSVGKVVDVSEFIEIDELSIQSRLSKEFTISFYNSTPDMQGPCKIQQRVTLYPVLRWFCSLQGRDIFMSGSPYDNHGRSTEELITLDYKILECSRRCLVAVTRAYNGVPDYIKNRLFPHYDTGNRLGIQYEYIGGKIVVKGINSASPGALNGLRVGDVISMINAKQITNPAEFYEMIITRQKGSLYEVGIQRGSENLIIKIPYSEAERYKF